MSIQKTAKHVGKKSIKNNLLKQDQLNATLGTDAAALPEKGTNPS